ncbi:MAG TPA: type II toxin-antitoxin system RelE/ParE family toxin [Anaerolineae bacterium]|nr:type II toxin-antitoxin system RelE/ParE family toxin [Anaerolineae bacterium]
MSKQADWVIELYARPDGSSPVVEFIEEQSRSNQAKILAELDDLAEFGLALRGSKVAPLEGKLWELRFQGQGLTYRFVYFAHSGRRFVVLHGFCKKTKKTPIRELAIARGRMQDYLERQP